MRAAGLRGSANMHAAGFKPELLLQCCTLSSMLSLFPAGSTGAPLAATGRAHCSGAAKWTRPAFAAGPCAHRVLLHWPYAPGAIGVQARPLNRGGIGSWGFFPQALSHAGAGAGEAGGRRAFSLSRSARDAPRALHVGGAQGWLRGGAGGESMPDPARRLASAGARLRARVGAVSGMFVCCVFLCACVHTRAHRHSDARTHAR